MAANDKPRPTGLEAPALNNGMQVTGKTKSALRRENKQRRKINQLEQSHKPDWWTLHDGLFSLPAPLTPLNSFRNQMCPTNLALHHPAASILLEYATQGCPVNTGQPWTKGHDDSGYLQRPSCLGIGAGGNKAAPAGGSQQSDSKASTCCTMD